MDPPAAAPATGRRTSRPGRRRRAILLAYIALTLLSLVTAPLRRPADPPPLPAGAERVDVVRRTAPGAEGRRPDAAPVAITFDRQGADGPLVVLLHGSPGDRTNFVRMNAAMPAGLRTIAIDLPGFGASSMVVPDYSPRVHAAYVNDLLDALGEDSVHVVGFSMGGAVGLRMIEQRPERVRSLTMLGATGIQEGEGSGDYAFEHLKYRVGWGLATIATRVVPHFGLLDDFDRGTRNFLRNFMDADQRPLHDVVVSMDVPQLVLHGTEDFLVPPWTAREHHRLAARSELVMREGGDHFDPFRDDGAAWLSEEIADFVARVESGAAVGGRVEDAGWAAHLASIEPLVGEPDEPDEPDEPGDTDPATPGTDPVDAHAGEGDGHLQPRFPVSRGGNPWIQMTIIAAATFTSEDATCIVSGLLARRGVIDIFVAILGCTVGIFVGDIGLWALGRFGGRRAMRWRWLARRLPEKRMQRVGKWIDRNAGRAIITSRFLPGTRFPLYVGAGMLGTHSIKFFVWFLIAALLWTPFIVLMVFAFGQHVVGPIESVFGSNWLALAVAVVVLLVLIRMIELSLTWRGRRRLAARVARLWRWEFWPTWIFYLPLVPRVLWKSVKYRGFNVVTAVNPGIENGGFVGEVKSEILDRLDDPTVLRSKRLDAEGLDARLAAYDAAVAELGLEFPIIIKPEVGERGFGVRCVHDRHQVEIALREHDDPMLVQAYHPGPHEAGIFYVREPGEAHGRIFAITHKVFPVITGDGRHSLRDLIWRHPRYRMQAMRFLDRHEAIMDDVLEAGRELRLAEAGNHAQGTLFADGSHLMSEALEQTIDAIALKFEGGFDFGRIDVRYTDVDELRAGRGFGILEINGATSEATNLYDPAHSLFAAYRILFAQWDLLFAIGAANRDRGVPVMPLGRLIATSLGHVRRAQAGTTSD